MNIRTLTNPINPVDSATTAQGVRPVKTEVSSEDRDADGRREQDPENKNPLSEEEMSKAKDHLEKLEGLKANGLLLSIEESGEYRLFLIKDKDGNVIRRIIEWEMRALIQGTDKRTGQIFDKSA